MTQTSNFDLIKKLKKVHLLGSLLLLAVTICVSTANAYRLTGVKWPQPSTAFYVDIPGGAGIWNDAFEGAMYEWNAATIFQFYIVRDTYSDPCDSSDNRNGVKFADTDCGDAWGSTTIAVCHYWYSGTTITQTDIVFNSNESWNVYSTSWQYSVSDFKRVAVHELGHALGLAHEDSGPLTIMGTYAGNITAPQQDDINGVAAIYGSACTYGISPSSGSFTAGGGTSLISVTATTSSCAWTASENLSWVSLSSTSGSGSGAISITVAANTGAARSGSIIIAGQPYIITQAAVTIILTPIYRFFNTTTGTHFYTSSFEEKNFVSNTLPQFNYEGIAFSGAGITSAANVSPVYRFFNSATGTHFYTISKTEKDNILSNLPNFNFEGEAYSAHTINSAGTKALHRFYNTKTGTHFYTASDAEKANVQNTLPHYTYEGIAYYVE